jgi:hypothetical protein
MDNDFLWRDGIDEASIDSILDEARSKGYKSIWLQTSNIVLPDSSSPVIIGTANNPHDPTARLYVHLSFGWIKLNTEALI